MQPTHRPTVPRNAYAFLTHHWRELGDQIMSALAINLLSLALPVMTLQIYDRILTSPHTGTLTLLISGVSIMILMEMILRIARSYLNGWSGAAYEHRLSCAAMRRVLHSDPLQRTHKHAGDYLSDMNAISHMRDYYGGQAWATLIDIPFLLIFVGMIAYLAGWLVMVPLALLAVFTVLAWAIGVSLKDSLDRRNKSDEARYNLLIETLEGIHSIKTQGLENRMLRRYESLQAYANPINYQVGQSSGIANNVGLLFGQIMVVAVVAAGAPSVINGVMTTGTLIACVLLSGRIMQPVQSALSLWTRYQDVALARQRVDTLMALPQIHTAPASRHAPRDGILRCEQLGLHIQGHAAPLLHDIDFTLSRGSSLALISDDARSATALMHLVAGLYRPSTGRVMIDGYDTTSYEARDLLRHVAYLHADAPIFRGSILENLTGFRDAKRAAAYEMAALLGIDHTVSKLPLGYETPLEGASADAIPPGIKQRIAMARLLLDKPRILLFDHADRALDKEGYNYVYRLLGRLRDKVAMIIASEDNNLLSLASHRIGLSQGRMVETDSSTHVSLHPYHGPKEGAA